MTDGTLQELMEQIRWDAAGLVPAVIQDAVSKDVLMLAYMNRESLVKSAETGETWFWSRSRSELWNKGATSGHVQKIKSLKFDCDADTLLVQVDQTGPACHTGRYSCFYRKLPLGGKKSPLAAEQEAGAGSPVNAGKQEAFRLPDGERFQILTALETLIAQREAERPEGAYTTYLFEKGLDKILKKVGEEASEVIIAAKNRSSEELRFEVSDLIFHLLVLMRDAKLPLDDVLAELESRHIRKPKGEFR